MDNVKGRQPPVVRPGSPESKQRALEMLEKMDAMDRIQERQSTRSAQHTLPAIMLPLWIWVMGLVFLPEGTPRFAMALFHASSLGGFLWLSFAAYRQARDASPARRAREKRVLEEDIARARRRQKGEDS